MDTRITELAAATAANNRAALGTGLADAATTQDRFLKLLVAQLNNQDPLNPLDNAQVTAQLAQLSTVQGIEKLNGSFAQMLEALQGMQSQQALAYAGRTVLVAGSTLAPVDGKALGGFELAAPADAIVVEIRDAAGQVVRTLELPPAGKGLHTFEWDGNTGLGLSAGAGPFSFAVNATAGTEPVAAQTLSGARVEGIVREGTGLRLNLGALGIKDVSDVVQLM